MNHVCLWFMDINLLCHGSSRSFITYFVVAASIDRCVMVLRKEEDTKHEDKKFESKKDKAQAPGLTFREYANHTLVFVRNYLTTGDSSALRRTCTDDFAGQ